MFFNSHFQFSILILILNSSLLHFHSLPPLPTPFLPSFLSFQTISFISFLFPHPPRPLTRLRLFHSYITSPFLTHHFLTLLFLFSLFEYFSSLFLLPSPNSITKERVRKRARHPAYKRGKNEIPAGFVESKPAAYRKKERAMKNAVSPLPFLSFPFLNYPFK